MPSNDQEERGGGGYRSRKNLIIAALAVNWLMISNGCIIAWPSPTIPKLMEDDSWIHINAKQAGLIGSTLSLGATLGPLFSILLLDVVGRKGTLFLIASIFLLSWVILGWSVSPQSLYSGRFIAGLGLGALYSASPTYVAEISEPEVRGALGSFMQVFTDLGFLVEYGVGPYVTYPTLIGLSACLALLFILFFAFVPESPYFLVAQGDFAKAGESLQWLRSYANVDQVTDELNVINGAVSRMKDLTGVDKVSLLFTHWPNFRALYLSCGLFVFLQLSGLSPVLAYSQPIFILSDLGQYAKLAPIVLGVVKLLASVLLPLLTKRFGMKRLLMVSAAGMSLCLLALGLFFYLLQHGMNTDSIGWLPLASLILYFIFLCFGMGSFPFVMMGELFDPVVKSPGTGIAISFNCFLSYLAMEYFSQSSSRPYLSLWGFALATALSLPYVYFLLPETKGMTLEEIQAWLGKPFRGRSDPASGEQEEIS